MDDLISRQAAIELIHSLYPSAPFLRMNKKKWKEKYKPYIETEKALKLLPPAQPERKNGKWTTEDCHAATYKYCCSECKAHHRAMYDFCPSCGADMR